MKIIVIGGKGHIGTYLCPMLIKEGHEVICITRGKSKPYENDYAWEKVQNLTLDRENDKDFPQKIADLNGDIVIDLINFKLEDTKNIVAALKKTNLVQYIFCSSIWTHGISETLPLDANSIKKNPIDDYGKEKFKCELYLKDLFLKENFPVSIVCPGQISGPGWNIINPWGNHNLKIFQDIIDGKEIFLPNFGIATLHHVHGKDVAQMFLRCIQFRNNALGRCFQAVSKNSITLYGYAKHIFEYFNKEVKIKFLDWKEWCEYEGNKEECDCSYYHIARSGSFSIEEEKKLINYEPQYTNVETIDMAIKSYVDRGLLTVK